MTYATTCRFAAVTCLALSVGYFFFPASIMGAFGVDSTPPAEFMARRAGVFLLGLAVLGWFAAAVTDIPSRKPVCISFAVAMTAMALLGLVEYFRGYAGLGMLSGVAVEVLFSFLFFRQLVQPGR